MELCFCQCGSCEKRQSTDDIVLVEYTKYDYGVVVEVEGKALVYNSVFIWVDDNIRTVTTPVYAFAMWNGGLFGLEETALRPWVASPLLLQRSTLGFVVFLVGVALLFAPFVCSE